MFQMIGLEMNILWVAM